MAGPKLASAAGKAAERGGGKEVSLGQGNGHHGIGISRRVHASLEGGIGGHLCEEGVELGFRHGTIG